jgi:serine/threonine protein kinase
LKTCAQCQIKYPDALEFCPQDGAPLPAVVGQVQPSYDDYIGKTVDGRYQIEAKLGEGGMGVVYAARHVIIDKRVAMKVLKREAQEEETAAQRFIQEAKSASKIGHANIVDITDFGQLPDGSAYFVMEFLEGQTLGQVIHAGPLPSRRVISVAAQIARGLNAAHSKGIIHRDLKPENIFLLERDGHVDVVKIVDFGIAKVQSGGLTGKPGARLTQVGMVLGTPEYMSPEQATGKETDHRVDEYALGCIMYEMLTGDVPFKGETSAGTLTKHVFDAVVPPSRFRTDLTISPAIEAVTLKAMAKKPDERYPSMKELLEALDAAGAEIDSGRDAGRAAYFAAERSRPTAAGPGIDDEIPRRSNTPLIAGAAGLVVVLAVVGGWLAFGRPGDAAVKGTEVAAPKRVKEEAPPPPEATKEAEEVKITLRSNPPNADVFLGPELLGTAPVTYKHAADQAPLMFTFKLKGYKDTMRELVPNESRDVETLLLKASRHGSSSSSSSKATASSGSSSAKTPEPAPSKPKTNGELRDPF